MLWLFLCIKGVHNKMLRVQVWLVMRTDIMAVLKYHTDSGIVW